MSNILSQNINDVKLTIIREYIGNYNVDLGVHRLVTVEKNIPLTKLEPNTALEYMTTPTAKGGLGLSSTDNIYKMVELFLSQTIESGGTTIKGDHFWIQGIQFNPSSDDLTVAFTDKLENTKEDADNYFWIFDLQHSKFNEWLTLFLNRNYNFALIEKKENTVGDLEKSDRIFAIANPKVDVRTDKSNTLEFLNPRGGVAAALGGGIFTRLATAGFGMRVKHKTLQGIRTYNTALFEHNVPLTNVELNTYKSKNVATYENAWGAGMVSLSKTIGGDIYADERIGLDYIIFVITGSIHKLFNQQIGVPYDDGGINVIENKLNDCMVQVGDEGWLARRSAKARDYSFKITVPERASIPNQKIVDRILDDTKVDFTLAGQIENLNATLNWKTTLV